jgi:hypothetical protein
MGKPGSGGLVINTGAAVAGIRSIKLPHGGIDTGNQGFVNRLLGIKRRLCITSATPVGPAGTKRLFLP